MGGGSGGLGWGKLVLIVVGVLIGLEVLGGMVGANDPVKILNATTTSTANPATSAATNGTVDKTETSKEYVPAAPSEEVETNRLIGTQLNAVRSAEQYLAMSGFSRDGLIGQLSSDAGDGYPVADATAAVDSLDVDWNENAAKSAKQYLGMSGFSCTGLVEQLSSQAGDKYTRAQASYGAQQAGAC